MSTWTAPPNWPQPPSGWRPPPGWQPDPAWGPAPPGWKFEAEDGNWFSRHKVLSSVLGVLALLFVVGLLTSGGDDGGGADTATQSDQEQTPEEKAAEAAEAQKEAEAAAAAAKVRRDLEAARAASAAAAALPPEPGDFTLDVIVLTKQCFGSAGCNVTFRIDPKHTGPRNPKDVDVTYEVLGGEDPLINTFTIDSAGNASFDAEEIISTDSSKAELSAKVTSVRKS